MKLCLLHPGDSEGEKKTKHIIKTHYCPHLEKSETLEKFTINGRIYLSYAGVVLFGIVLPVFLIVVHLFYFLIVIIFLHVQKWHQNIFCFPCWLTSAALLL